MVTTSKQKTTKKPTKKAKYKITVTFGIDKDITKVASYCDSFILNKIEKSKNHNIVMLTKKGEDLELDNISDVEFKCELTSQLEKQDKIINKSLQNNKQQTKSKQDNIKKPIKKSKKDLQSLF